MPNEWHCPAGSMMMYDGHMGGWGMVLMGLFWILLLLVVVLLLRPLLFTGAGGHVPSEDSPVDILRKRYAKGEITKAEFDRMKEDLQV